MPTRRIRSDCCAPVASGDAIGRQANRSLDIPPHVNGFKVRVVLHPIYVALVTRPDVADAPAATVEPPVTERPQPSGKSPKSFAENHARLDRADGLRLALKG